MTQQGQRGYETATNTQTDPPGVSARGGGAESDIYDWRIIGLFANDKRMLCRPCVSGELLAHPVVASVISALLNSGYIFAAQF